MKKAKSVKPLTEQRRLRRWLRRLFGRQPRPSELFAAHIGGALDEMHLVPDRVHMEAVEVSVGVMEDVFTKPPVPEDVRRVQIQQALAEKLAREIIDQGLASVHKHEDYYNFRTYHHATVRILRPKEGKA